MCHSWEEEGAGSMEEILTTKTAAFFKNTQRRGTGMLYSGRLMAVMLSEHTKHCFSGWV